MKFYVVSDGVGQVVGCERSRAEAIGSLEGESGVVTRVEVAVSAESIRRLLGELGGYAVSVEEVFWRGVNR